MVRWSRGEKAGMLKACLYGNAFVLRKRQPCDSLRRDVGSTRRFRGSVSAPPESGDAGGRDYLRGHGVQDSGSLHEKGEVEVIISLAIVAIPDGLLMVGYAPSPAATL